MISSQADHPIIELFGLPYAQLDEALVVVEMNRQFADVFGEMTGRAVTELSRDFNDRKFQRRLAAGQSYDFTIIPPNERRVQYTLALKPHEDGFIGLATDTSAAAKTEAMLESYSELIEKQNREIKAKTEQLNIWRERIENELQQANEVQDLLVPEHLVRPNLDARCLALHELSGDFHEFASHDDGQVTFITGDVAGKGIYAAMMLAQTLTAFRACYSAEHLHDVAVQIVDMLDGRFPDGLFVALTLVRQSADKQTVHVLNLGNPDALVMDDDGMVAEIPSAGPAIGVLPSVIYAGLEATTHSLTGRRLYVFSDGVLDGTFGPQYTGFDTSAEVAEMLKTFRDQHQDDAMNQLFEMVKKFKQIDDITLACFNAEG